MKYTLLYLFVLCPIFIWAQSNSSKTPTTVISTNHANTATIQQAEESNFATLKKELEGTFAIEISQANYQVLYTEDLLETIKTSRKATETVRLAWNPYTILVIFPLQHAPAPISNSPKSE